MAAHPGGTEDRWHDRTDPLRDRDPRAEPPNGCSTRSIDDFRIETDRDHGTTRLVGEIRDPSHLNGLLAHFTSMNVEVVGLHRLAPEPDSRDPERTPPHPNHPTNQEGTTP
jgi:hypothetical protein